MGTELAGRAGSRGSSTWGLGLADAVGLAVLWVATAGRSYICPFPLEIVTSPGCLVFWSLATNAWLLFKEASWDVKKRGLGWAAARASQEDRRADVSSVAPMTHCQIQREGLLRPGLAFPSVKWVG